MEKAEQFAGLQMDKSIKVSVNAATDNNIRRADSATDFINHEGSDKDGKVKNAAFGYQKCTENEDGTSNLDEMKVDVPKLNLMPIPDLRIEEVNVRFDI